MRILSVYAAALLLLAGCSSSDPKDPDKPDVPAVPDKPAVDPADKDAVDVDPNALYNGLQLPTQWPPRRNSATDIRKGMSPFYFSDGRPEVVYALQGRQLFVDEFLIDSNLGLRRVFHYPDIQAAPVLVPDRAHEVSANGKSRFAAPFSDGVWYDEAEGLFKMWYMGGSGVTCYAESPDGLNWTKPAVSSIMPGTNVVRNSSTRDAVSVIMDKRPEAPARYHMFEVSGGAGAWQYHYLTSADGKQWRDQQAPSQRIADRSSVFYSPFRNVWVWSMRHNVRLKSSDPYTIRARDYAEHPDAAQGNRQAKADLKDFWFGTWPQERRWEGNTANDGAPGIYNFDAMPYESVMLGYFSVWQGPENEECNRLGMVKRNQVCLGYSRDGGYSWQRDDMAPFLPLDEADASSWRTGNIQSALGSPIIVGDLLYFYFSGRRIDSGVETTSTGLATLRRDGFASMSGTGTLTTVPMLLDGTTLWLNARIGGSLKVEVLHRDGTPYEGLSAELSNADGCSLKGLEEMGQVKGRAVRLRFTLSDADLYSFWAGDAQGHSRGYTAGGGPGLSPSGIDQPL